MATSLKQAFSGGGGATIQLAAGNISSTVRKVRLLSGNNTGQPWNALSLTGKFAVSALTIGKGNWGTGVNVKVDVDGVRVINSTFADGELVHNIYGSHGYELATGVGTVDFDAANSSIGTFEAPFLVESSMDVIITAPEGQQITLYWSARAIK